MGKGGGDENTVLATQERKPSITNFYDNDIRAKQERTISIPTARGATQHSPSKLRPSEYALACGLAGLNNNRAPQRVGVKLLEKIKWPKSSGRQVCRASAYDPGHTNFLAKIRSTTIRSVQYSVVSEKQQNKRSHPSDNEQTPRQPRHHETRTLLHACKKFRLCV